MYSSFVFSHSAQDFKNFDVQIPHVQLQTTLTLLQVQGTEGTETEDAKIPFFIVIILGHPSTIGQL